MARAVETPRWLTLEFLLYYVVLIYCMYAGLSAAYAFSQRMRSARVRSHAP